MNSENKVYSKAVIDTKRAKIYKIMFTIFLLSLLILIISLIPIRKGELIRDRFYSHFDYFNLFGEDIAVKYNNDFGFTYRASDESVFFWISLIVCVLTLIIGGIFHSILKVAKQSSLELNYDGIIGKKKKLFSMQSLNMPFEKIDSIYVKDGIKDKIFGGKTIVICSASSRVGLICIANAQEFVDKTLEELKKYKESVASTKEKAPASSESDAMDALLKLKSLLDQGLISQEEFEEKRRSLAEKI